MSIEDLERCLESWKQGAGVGICRLIGPVMAKQISDVTASSFIRLYKLFYALMNAGCRNCQFVPSAMLVALRKVFREDPLRGSETRL